MKVNELTGAALDWAVAKCEGWEWRCPWMLEKNGFVVWQRYEAAWGSPTPNYSTDWAQGGPIIEREKLDLWWCEGNGFYTATKSGGKSVEDGATPLIAAMRCYVASKLGDEVEIPTELTQGETV